MSSYEYGCAVAEKSEAPIGTRTQLIPIPLVGLNSAFINWVWLAALSLLEMSQAEVSVIAAPKPAIVWYVVASSTVMFGVAEFVVKARPGCAASRLLRLLVVSHFWTGTAVSADADD